MEYKIDITYRNVCDFYLLDNIPEIQDFKVRYKLTSFWDSETYVYYLYGKESCFYLAYSYEESCLDRMIRNIKLKRNLDVGYLIGAHPKYSVKDYRKKASVFKRRLKTRGCILKSVRDEELIVNTWKYFLSIEPLFFEDEKVFDKYFVNVPARFKGPVRDYPDLPFGYPNFLAHLESEGIDTSDM